MPPARGHPGTIPLLRSSLIVAFAILFLPLAFPLVTWRVMTAGDLGQFHLPMRFVYQQALSQGDSFLWSSALGSGVYLHAEGQTGMAHPFHLLIYRVLPLTAAVNVEMLSSYLFAAAGMWLLLRRLTIAGEAAVGGALMFGFSGFTLLHLNHLNAVAVVAHAPWLLWAADLAIAGRDRRARAFGFAATAAVLGSEVLLGFPQAVWLDGVALGWFGWFRIAGGTPWRRLLPVAVALACGVLIGAVQWLPTLDALRSSLRAETTAAFRLSYSLHPVNLVQLVSPYALEKRIYAPAPGEHFMHEFGVYDGAIATLALCWIALRWPMLSRRREAAGFIVLAALGVVLALGRYGGVYRILALLPAISSLRAPTRHIMLVHLAFAGLVAIVLEDLSRIERRAVTWRRLSLLSIPVFLSLIVAALVYLAARTPPHALHGVGVSGITAALAGSGFIGITALLFAAAGRGHRLAVPALILVTAIDLFCWGTRYIYATPPAPISSLIPGGGRPAAARDGDLVHPSAMRNDMNLYPMLGLRSSTVYLGLVRASVLDPHRRIAQRIAGVNWTWTSSGWSSLPGSMPRARLVSEWRIEKDIAGAVDVIDVARTALVPTTVPVAPGPSGAARVLSDNPGTLVVETSAPANRLLVLTERFHPGWRARVDGISTVEALPVYGDYLGCVVPAGTHRIALDFAPASARIGFWITLAGLAATVGGALALSRFLP